MKVLAIGSIVKSVSDEDKKEIMPKEVPATLKHYLDGKIEQFWASQDAPGGIFLKNVGRSGKEGAGYVGGATGATRSVATKFLLEKGFPVRAFVHKDDERAHKLHWLAERVFDWAGSPVTHLRPNNAFVSGLVALILCLMNSGAGYAQPANPPTPTTRILAIGTMPAGVDPAKVRAILPNEVRKTVDLYLAGKIDQWYSLQGRVGVAFILNVTDTATAHELLEQLPLGQAHLMTFELIPLAPLNPLRQLHGRTAHLP
jgi:hypothetical protein